MRLVSTDLVMVALDKSEIETIISALESDYYEWRIEEAGILMNQFKKIYDDLFTEE